MNHTYQTVRVGLFFLIGLALIYVVYSVIGDQRLREGSGYKIMATYDDIKTVTRGADVRMAGVRIGEVESTFLRNGRGEMALRIMAEYQIPADSVARIAIASLLGQNYIAVEYGSGSAFLSGGDEILTEDSMDINKLFSQLGELGEKMSGIADQFSGFGEGEMGDFFGNMNGLVSENRDSLGNIVKNLETLTATLNSTEGTIGKLINDDGAYNEIMATVAEIQGAAKDARGSLANVQGIFDRLERGDGTLGMLLNDDTIARNLNETVANFNKFSKQLSDGEGTLGKLLGDDELYRELQAILQKAQRALDGMGDAGPITAAGAVSGALF